MGVNDPSVSLSVCEFAWLPSCPSCQSVSPSVCLSFCLSFSLTVGTPGTDHLNVRYWRERECGIFDRYIVFSTRSDIALPNCSSKDSTCIPLVWVLLLLGHDLIPLSPGIVNRLSQFIGRMRLEIAFAIERDISTLRDPLSAWTPSKH